jgi:predicted alpha/beta-fold hydrolase
LPDGDALVLHDDQPDDWRPGDPAVLMLHGLAGCHLSPYMVRIARRLNHAGVRSFRMNARAAGDGAALARLPYHAGRSPDVHAALNTVAELCPGSPVLLIGFSLGGVVMIKLAGELGARAPGFWKGLLAVCPPVDLSACVHRLRLRGNRLYDWYFCRLLRGHLRNWQSVNPNAVRHAFKRPPRTLLEFDDEFTAPLGGFESAEHYYRECNPTRFLPTIAVPTTVLAAGNDPLAPASDLLRADVSDAVTRRVEAGGHLGFFGKRNADGRRWLDSFVAAWVKASVRGASVRQEVR